MSEEQIKSVKEEKKELYEKARKESEKTEESWRNSLKTQDIIDEAEYFQMKHYIKMVVEGHETGTIIKSRGGTGKTTTTLGYLSKENIPFAYMNSYSTPTAFFIWIFKNRKKIKVIDDVHKLLENDKFAPFLKAMLEGFNGKRTVFYNTSKPIEDSEGTYPNSFDEEGGTIILTNRINEKSIHIDAILSRVPMCELNISNERMIELMTCIAKKKYKDMTIEENNVVLNFCKEHLKNSIDLNLRTFNHARNFFNYAKNQKNLSQTEKEALWKRLITQSLKKDDTDLVIMQIAFDDKYATEDEKLEEINKCLTKKISRATYFRRVKELKGTGE